MKFELTINSVRTIRELPEFWTEEDYRNLLEAFDFDDVGDSKSSELEELLCMVISDLEAHEAAEIILRYKLGDKLNEGQIKNLSHEMTEENESEEYPDISLHYPLFNINQLLFKAFNGIFTNAKASRFEIVLKLPENPGQVVDKEVALKALSTCLSERNLIVRLYKDQLTGKSRFTDADYIVWELEKKENDNYVLVTSDYWMNNEDLINDQVKGAIHHGN